MTRRSDTRTQIEAVHSDDLIEVLQALGALEQMERGECLCVACGGTVTPETVAAARHRNDRLEFICTKPQCAGQFT